MRITVMAMLAAALLLAQGMPRMTTCEPGNGKAGDVLTISGENLAKDVVDKFYLTDGKTDIPVEVVEQAAQTVKFKIPAKAPAGRWSLMLLTAGKEPKLIEQPVKVTVE